MKKSKEKKLLEEIIFWIKRKRKEYIMYDKYAIHNYQYTKYEEILRYLDILLKNNK